MRVLARSAMLVVALLACRGEGREGSVRLDAATPSLADSADARRAVEQYLDALRRRDYQRAARLYSGQWRDVAARALEAAPDTLTLAGFLQQNCDRGFYVCRLRLDRATDVAFRRPDTIALSVTYTDSLGRPYAWGPCCGETGPPSRVDRFVTVARDSGYAVLNLPLYLP